MIIGILDILDDSTILLILSFLSAIDLSRFGQCSRILTVFCSHEPLWKDLLLNERGCLWGTWRGNFKDTYTGGEHHPFPVKGFYSDLLNKSWVCATARFNPFWKGVDMIPRERSISVEDFIQR